MKKLLLLLTSAFLLLAYTSCRPDVEDPSDDDWANRHCTPIVQPEE